MLSNWLCEVAAEFSNDPRPDWSSDSTFLISLLNVLQALQARTRPSSTGLAAVMGGVGDGSSSIETSKTAALALARSRLLRM